MNRNRKSEIFGRIWKVKRFFCTIIHQIFIRKILKLINEKVSNIVKVGGMMRLLIHQTKYEGVRWFIFRNVLSIQTTICYMNNWKITKFYSTRYSTYVDRWLFTILAANFLGYKSQIHRKPKHVENVFLSISNWIE